MMRGMPVDLVDPLRGCKGIMTAIAITVGGAALCLIGYFVVLALTGAAG